MGIVSCLQPPAGLAEGFDRYRRSVPVAKALGVVTEGAATTKRSERSAKRSVWQRTVPTALVIRDRNQPAGLFPRGGCAASCSAHLVSTTQPSVGFQMRRACCSPTVVSNCSEIRCGTAILRGWRTCPGLEISRHPEKPTGLQQRDHAATGGCFDSRAAEICIRAQAMSSFSDSLMENGDHPTISSWQR